MMIKCYIELYYLLSQGGAELRLLKWSQINEKGIYFNPTKTEHSSGVDVIAQMIPEIKAILDVVKSLTDKETEYIFVTKKGEPFTANGLRSAWRRACERVGITGITIKDIRPKSLTDASLSGFEIKQLSVIAAYSDTKTTERYIKKKETPVNDIKLSLPDNKKDDI